MDYVSILIILGIILFFSIGLLPTWIAISKKHKDKTAIILINVLLFWSFIGWVVALVWAVKKPTQPTIVYMNNYPGNENNQNNNENHTN